MLGDSNVGKSSIIKRLIEDKFVEGESKSSIGIDYDLKGFLSGNKLIQM